MSFVLQDAALMPWAIASDKVQLPLRLSGRSCRSLDRERMNKRFAALNEIARARLDEDLPGRWRASEDAHRP